jgi:esterase/lipase|tara:strand:- start:727 stop:1119 length:393 start_codon:yes stop_codon:yes gene_type:complete
MELKLILAFALGFIVCKIFNILFLTRSAWAFILEIHLQTLSFIGNVEQTLAYVRATKQIILMSSGKSEKEVSSIMQRYDQLEQKIKDTIIDSYKEAFPDNFKFIVKDMTWDSAMEDLTTFIKNQKEQNEV